LKVVAPFYLTFYFCVSSPLDTASVADNSRFLKHSLVPFAHGDGFLEFCHKTDFFFFETVSPYGAQAGLEVALSNPPASAS
jgi:hypothetical protein